MGGESFKEKKQILKSKPTKVSKGGVVPGTTFGALQDASVIKKVENKTKKPFKAASFKPVKVKGTKTPFGLKPLSCKPAYMYATPKYLTDNTRPAKQYKPQGFPTEQFLKIPRQPNI
jgi:hypothetical protein